MGHVLPGYPAGPIVRAVFDHQGNETLTLGPDGIPAGGLPADVSLGIGINKVQGNLIDILEGSSDFFHRAARQQFLKSNGG